LTFGSSIFRKLLLAAVLLIAVALGSTDFLLTRYTANRERLLAQQEMAVAARILAPTLAAAAPQALEQWARDADLKSGWRVTVIDPRGIVLADSRHDPESMENHGNRPEIRAALAGQTGVDIRRSATLDIDFSYLAVPASLAGGAPVVLRLAVPLEHVGASIAAVRSLILRASAIAMLIALVVAWLISQAFARRIRRVQTYAKDLVNADYSGDLAIEADDELGSVARSLRAMAEQFRNMLKLLSQESARRSAILSGMVEGVLAVDHDLRVTFYNEAFARAVNARTPLPENPSVLQLLRDPPLRELLLQVIAEGRPARARMALLGAGGHTFEVQAAPLDEPGKRGAIATLHDITELERLERVRKDFVANISHELRTPLAAIRGYTETLLDGALEDAENNRKFLEIVDAQAVRLSDLASDLLALSELEAVRTPPPAERVSVLQAAENALRTVATQARARNVRVHLGDAEDLYILGGIADLERTLVNLILNGIMYNHSSGEVRVDIQKADGSVRICVSDTGFGIPTAEIPRIFERFYRVDKARSRQTGGTGLGLAIVKHSVERMGGSIAVESTLRKGSVFTLIFRAA
jgi:two-component system phosphate regulon sensor histidine kinase PhoR